MKNTFPNVQQAPDSKTCGPNCLLNIYSSLDKEITLKDILKDLGVRTRTSTHTAQIGAHFLKHGLKPIILSSCTFNISPSWEGKSENEVLNLLEKRIKRELKEKNKVFPKNTIEVNKLKTSWLKDELYLYFYLKHGGGLRIADLTTKLIDEYLNQDYLLIPCLEESWLWGERKIKGNVEFDSVKGDPRGHFVVIYSESADNYLISDPYPTKINGRNGLYQIPKDKLLVATLLWGGQILAVKK